MAAERLTILTRPKMRAPRMVLGFSGWMDGGDVSTGTIRTLVRKLGAEPLAEIDSEDFYILNFPGSMEVSGLFRPHTKIEDGLIQTYRGPSNTFFCGQADRLILFLGKEPNLRWTEYTECLFSLAEQFAVSRIYFVGSVAGLVPHTREPRLYASMSDARLKGELERLGMRFSDYEGPASIVTYLTREATARQVEMVNLVAETPAYVQGRNPRCIESVTRRLAGMLELQIDLEDLRRQSDRLEEHVNRALEKHPDLKERIAQLEEHYDNDVFDTQMTDLKEWLERKGIRLD
jgi:proteasome assembly chaperone (PAC2) family protein